MAITLPASPTLNQTYTLGSKTWIWNGTSWRATVTATTVASYDTSTTSTGYLALPSGNTVQRPPTPTVGNTRWNTTLSVAEVWTGTSWFPYANSLPATASIEILVVAGGGTGGQMIGGASPNRGTGGGAGGLIYLTSFPVIVGSTYIITLGAGGSSLSGTATSNGNNSVVTNTSAGRTLTAIGGGSGGYGDSTNNGQTGGSGGGQWYPGYTGAASIQPVATYDGLNTYATTGWGNKGGDSSNTQPYGSGGGGAGGAGGNWNGANGPVGGLGKTYDISGTTTTYAGGGSSDSFGGSLYVNTNYGGLGGGGTGYNASYNTASNGQSGKGGGGGSGGSGGGGIVILRYSTAYAAAISTTGSPTITNNGSYRIYNWTTSGSITF